MAKSIGGVAVSGNGAKREAETAFSSRAGRCSTKDVQSPSVSPLSAAQPGTCVGATQVEHDAHSIRLRGGGRGGRTLKPGGRVDGRPSTVALDATALASNTVGRSIFRTSASNCDPAYHHELQSRCTGLRSYPAFSKSHFDHLTPFSQALFFSLSRWSEGDSQPKEQISSPR